jgi:putative hemolysin
MSPWLVAAVLVLLLLLSGIFSGSETGAYSLSRARLDAEVGAKRRPAQLLARLVRNDTAFLIALLVGNNLMLGLLTQVFETSAIEPLDLPAWSTELVVTGLLVPVVFLLGELIPKDVFRRRPHLFLTLATPILGAARILLLPISLPLQALTVGLERLLGLRRMDFVRALGRERLMEILQEGTRTGAIEPHAEELARNVLVLRGTPVGELALPWEDVVTVDLDGDADDVRRAVVDAEFTRLPATRSLAEGRTIVAGYVHQLDVLGNPDADARALQRPIPHLDPALGVNRALARLRISGQRLALVGTPEEPLGLVTLMDLVDVLAGGPRSTPRAPADDVAGAAAR